MRICLGARGRYEGIGKGVDVDGFRMFRGLGAMRKKYMGMAWILYA